jgi:predicted GNAT family N-acyltransferase
MEVQISACADESSKQEAYRVRKAVFVEEQVCFYGE